MELSMGRNVPWSKSFASVSSADVANKVNNGTTIMLSKAWCYCRRMHGLAYVDMNAPNAHDTVLISDTCTCYSTHDSVLSRASLTVKQ